MRYLDDDRLREILAAKVEQVGSQRAVAQELGVTHPELSMSLRGVTRIPRSIGQALGFRERRVWEKVAAEG